MIRELEIQNFQSHKETRLEFDPGVNVIVGQSDSGKTAIIRALHWLVWNRPLGDAFRSDWGGDTLAVLTIDDTIVERFKGKEDHYKLWNDLTEPPIEFKAFGKEVPEEIVQALNFSDINFQEQMDSSFLISANPGEVARHFSKVANITQIHTSQKAVESWIRQINQDIKTQESNIEDYQEQLEEFEYLDQLEADVEVLEQLTSSRQQTANKAQKIQKVLTQVGLVEEDIKIQSELLEDGPLVEELTELYTEKEATEEERNLLTSDINKIIEVEEELFEFSEITKYQDAVDSLLELYNKKKQANDNYQNLVSLFDNIEITADKLKAKKRQLKKLETKWHKVAPETCPLCDGTGTLKKQK